MDALLKPTVRANTRQRHSQPHTQARTTANAEQAYIHLPIAQRSLPKRKILHNRDQATRNKRTRTPSQRRHKHPDISPSTCNPRHTIQFHSTKLNKFSPHTACSTTPAHDAHPNRTPANARRRQTHIQSHTEASTNRRETVLMKLVAHVTENCNRT
jgi:hypothetical protein